MVLGCATFGYGIYQDEDKVVGELPVRVVRLALRAGMTAFDTGELYSPASMGSLAHLPAPFYHPSELVLGRALAHPAVRTEFPRESYKIITKTGKFGPKLKDHVYDPEVIRRSVERSLRRLQTDYLDVVCEWLYLPYSRDRDMDREVSL